MTSRLSSLLVRDGLVRVQRMEGVFQRQVIHGGSLDTILLEMGLVEAPRLQQYLSLATGLPPAHEGLQEPDEALLKICTEEIATRYRVAPVKLEDGALEVWVCDPVEVETLESLADALDLSVQPMVVPEYQFRLALSRLYGQATDARFEKLAKQHIAFASNGVGKHVPTVTIGERSAPEEVDDEDSGGVPLAISPEATQPADTSERVRGKRPPAEQPARRMTMELNTDSLRDHVQATMAMAADAPKIIIDEQLIEDTDVNASAPQLVTESELADTNKTLDMPRMDAADVDRPPARKPAAEQAEPAPESAENSIASALGGVQSERAPAGHKTSVESSAPPAAEETGETVQPYPAITPDQARALLDASEDRDEIFIILLRAMRKHARHTALFTVKGQTASGRIALTKAGLDNDEIRSINIDLGASSRFQSVTNSKAFSVGPLQATDDGVRAALELLGGGEVPKSALLLPVVVRDRVIAIAVAHNRDKGINVGRVTELLPLGTATADAVNRLLAKMRAAASAANSESASAVSKPAATDSASESNNLPVANEEMIKLFARLESDDPDVFEAACAEAIEKSGEAIEHLSFCFPGKLVRSRDDSADRLRAADHGPILDLITRLGAKCGPALSEKMSDADREVRYYATLCAAELRPAQVLNELVERLFDTDDKIRELAVGALAGYPKDDLLQALDFARRALHSEDNGRVKVAADGLTKLGDTSCISDLIDAHSRGGDAAQVSRSALFQLTNQDFGNSTRKWRNWWEKNNERHRIEWMLDGLSHKNTEVRQHACETLRSLTGEYFGYGHDLPKKERDQTRQLWLDWWAETGKERFS